MSLADYEQFVIKACWLDADDPVALWKQLGEKQARVAELLNSKKQMRIVAESTDLTLGIEGRKWISCDGRYNFPDGEIFTAPLEDATNGTISYSFPAIAGGREVEGIRLTFKDGKVVDATATKGQEYLQQMIETDEGAKILGELAIGTNYGIQQHTKNTLYDEKIGGTCHLALGAGYPEAGSKNSSGLHWDMVCDLRKGGRIYVDGELIYKDGHFTVIDL